MARLREWIVRLLGTLRPSRTNADLEQELKLHLELAAEDERRRSRNADSARTAALRLGPVTQTVDALHDQRGLPWLDDVIRDVRQALRALRRNPLFAGASLLTLAVGNAANTAVFTVVNSVLLRPLAYPKSDELVAVWHAAPGAPGLASVSGDLRLSASMYFTYVENNRTFQQLGLWFMDTVTVTGVAEPEEVRSLIVSDGTLQALGVQPVLGRWLSAAEHQPSGPQSVLLGYGYWQRRFGGDPSVVGRTISTQAQTREIVGVMPRGFRVGDAEPEVILPFGFDRSKLILAGFGFQAIGRLKPGVTIAEANADVARMLPMWMRSWPAPPGVDPLVYESWRIVPSIRPLK